ncbi:serine protease inhibitor-like isoform X1 [Hydractinia symbiolongicarpus]|uniref:serine protease inhibitor-like isoform X1 n=1 Tax=Hydractinia symbiolongicarpus TaxID=13093 RepID=UPI00254EB76A|nr:serine protease inhibitor-like isoform X1 [Hydractinia symbiolongicarpus]
MENLIILFVFFLSSVFVVDADYKRNFRQQKVVHFLKKLDRMAQARKLVNDFNYKMFNHILNTSNGNVVFSPYSISSAMAMVHEGSKTNTRKEIETTFGWGGIDENKFHELVQELVEEFESNNSDVSLANRVWIDQENDVMESYKENLKTFYKAVLGTEDFQKNSENARRNINNWVAQQTENNIKDLFPDGSIDSTTKLVLANAIFFKGKWKIPFEKEHTRKSEFKLEDGKNIEVDMMWKSDKFDYLAETEFQVVKIPYAGEKYSMFVAIPLKMTANKLAQSTTPDVIQNWLKRLKPGRYPEDVDVYLPTFKIQHAVDLKKGLQQLGITDLFTSGKADLSGINGKRELYCSGAYHKAFIEVDEEGTVAGGATGFGTTLKFMPPQIRADRPFVFYIVDHNTDAILFAGKVADPTSS